MISKERNDYFYVCSLIEYTARKTRNKRGVIVNAMGLDGIKKQLEDAEVSHCLSFEQVSDEIMEKYGIKNGDFDTVTDCKYSIPGYVDIGKLYTYIIEDLTLEGHNQEIKPEILLSVFNSFISDEISDFATGVYYENPSYLRESYKAGYLLDLDK